MHTPTPTMAVPPTMRVAVEIGFVQSCPDCRATVERLAVSCIGDPTVTAFRAAPGKRHAHEVTEGTQALPGLATGSTAQLPISDTNGDDPQLVEAALWANTDNVPNGFDA